ncbi:MAG TPA: outer membrane protein transport protein [Thermoanaerobaculia bacterium]|nr:outer membrane protein transport protein [Thermoanaerobaculia bacterium]
MRLRTLPPALALLAVLVVFGLPARGQSNDEIQTGAQFNFSTPGARSLGLGGAFLGLADDATAAYANPAGLAQLAASEVSVEGRSWRFESRFAAGGHTPETGVTGIGIDTAGGVQEGRIARETAAASFLSTVYSGGRWAIALYRHQLADYEAAIDSQGPFVGGRGNTARTQPVRSQLDLEIWHVGAAGSWRVTDGLFLGASLSSYDFALSSRTERFARNPPTGDPVRDGLTGNHFGPADFLPENLSNIQTQDGEDRDWGVNLGLLWKANGQWSVGAVYRQGPDFGFRAEVVDGPRGNRPGQVREDLGGSGLFHVPDVFGVGVVWRASDELTFAFDWDHVRYSALTEDLVNVLRTSGSEPEHFAVDDANELHLGCEWQTLASKLPFAVRLGAWWDPDHRIRYQGTNELLLARFRRGEDELHLAGGLGVVIHRLQLDLAADVSETTRTFSLSAVARF